MAIYNLWRGDAEAEPRIASWVIEEAEVGDTFNVKIGNKIASYTLTQDDVDDATGDQTNSSVAMRGVYAAVSEFITDQVPEFKKLTIELVTDEENTDEVVSLTVTGDQTVGRPFTETLSTGDAGNLDVDVTEVTAGSAGQNEIQHVMIAGTATGGTFTLEFDGETTNAIAYNATAGTVTTELELLTNIDDVTVTGSAGGPWLVEFKGVWSNLDVPLMIGDGTNITKAASGYAVNVETIQTAVAGVNEIQRFTIPSTSTGGTFTLTFEGQTTGAIAYDASAGAVETALELLTTIDQVTVTKPSTATWHVEFTGTHEFINVTTMTGSGASLTGSADVVAETIQEGSDPLNLIQRRAVSVSVNLQVALRKYVAGVLTSTDTFTIHTDSTAQNIQDVVDTLPNQTPGDIVVTKDTYWHFEMTGNYAGLGSEDDNRLVVTVNGGLFPLWEIEQEAAATGIDEIQTLTVTGGPTGGTFTVTFEGQTTGNVAYNASAAALEAELEGLSNLTPAEVSVTKSGNTFTVTFDLSRDCAEMTTDPALLTGGAVTVTTVQSAVTPVNEQQEISIAGNPLGGTFALSWNPGAGTETTGNIAFDAAATDIQTELEGLATPGPGDFDVTGAAGGPWIVEFTGDYEGVNVNEITGDPALLSGAEIFVSTTQSATDPENEQQQVELTGSPDGGTFTLTFSAQTTSAIPYNAGPSLVQAVLESLSTIAVGDISVTGSDGGPWFVNFQGTLGNQNVSAISGSGAGLTSSGTQTFVATQVQAATGPNHYDEDTNWSLGHMPATDETPVFQDNDVDCLFGLVNDDTTPERVVVKASMTGDIGLPDWNEDGFYEYLPTHLVLGTHGDGSSDTMYIDIGEGEGNGSSLIRLDTNTKNVWLSIFHTGNSFDGLSPVVQWKGLPNDTARADVYRGSFSAALKEDEEAELTTLKQAHRGNVDNDSSVHIGQGCVVGTIEKTGGELLLDLASTTTVTDFSNTAGNVSIMGEGNIRVASFAGGTTVSSTTGTIGHFGTIAGATQANPCVVETSSAHNLITGDKVRIGGVVGMTQLNQNEYTIVVTDSTHFQLAGVNSTAYTAYSSGGYFGKIGSIEVARDASLLFTECMVDRFVAVAIDVYGDEAEVQNSDKKVTTLTYLTGEFAIHYHHAGPVDGLPQDGIVVFR